MIGGYNITEDDEGNPIIYNDYQGHGTHVSGIIASTNNGKCLVGVPPEILLPILKVISSKRAKEALRV
ncbi:S8 family serine peptidase [Peribacillus simplex]|uniref:S8 family serine peptidase n=1 Tax=Peribacillus simplex TaxID=1478 RepID=UPI00296FCB5F|nr:S8 family serine peptidase [Peribacillus simplex]